MGFSNFLSAISILKSLEFKLDEQFNDLVKNSNDSSDYSEKSSQWIIDYLSYVDDLRKFASSNLVIPKRYVEMWLSSSPSIIVKSLDDICSLVDFESWKERIDGKSYLDEMTSCIVFTAVEILKNQRLESFYEEKLIQLEYDLYSIQQKLLVKTQIIENKEERVIFDNLIKYLDIQRPLTINESTYTIPKELDSHPFHNDDVRDFYLYLESKYTISKSYHSAFYKFFKEEGLIDLKDEKRIRQSFFYWINERYNLQGDDKIVKLQTNLENFNLEDFEKHLTAFEESKGLNFYFHDFRDGGINRTKKKPSSKN